MNSTQIKLVLKYFLAFLFVGIFRNEVVFAKMAAADFAPMQPEQASPVSETVRFYTKKQRTKKLNLTEADILKLSLLAQEVFEINSFFVPENLSTEKTRVEAITSNYIAGLIQKSIEKKSDWDEPLSKANLEKLKQNSELLKKTLSDSSYAWAWINYQTGLKKEAKTILVAKFEAVYNHVMQIQAVYSHESSPLSESERIFKILKPMSDEDENKSREDQLKKMRTHISGLPDIQIMT